ncbi:MAG: YgjV family protein [Gemmatimonadetes bacterium]|nr:YgjV family protein [Gemmatimonadota bacterium]
MSFDSFQLIGWAATALTIGSYFCRDAAVLRRVQAVAALVWIAYGLAIAAPPIIAANVLVAGVAAWSSVRKA